MTTGLHRLLERLGWQPEAVTPMIGGYAANLFRVRAWDERGQEVEAVYKRFAAGRAQELDLYQNVLRHVPSGVPRLYGTVQEGEQGMLLEAAGDVLKRVFRQASWAEKQELLQGALNTLADLHVSLEAQSRDWLANGLAISYPFESSEAWAADALQELRYLAEQGIAGVDDEDIAEVAAMITAFYPRYRSWLTGRETFTHGDPHMENVVLAGEQFRLIDWEFASVTLPQRDLSILLQDVLEDGLHQHGAAYYYAELGRRGWQVAEREFWQGFRACLFDNTLMMLGWEVGKYRNGHLSRAEIEDIAAAKLRWIRSSYAELVDE